MQKEVYLVKSLEEDFATKTLEDKEKVTFQTIYDIIKTKKIKPNTKSFGRKRRLSTTILSPNYLKTYRPQGIIFKTSQKPDYIIPFDLVLAGATNKIIVHYYRIKNDLHIYYNHTLIPGFEKFIFKDFKEMIKKCKSPFDAWKQVNSFRKENGFNSLPKQKFRLVTYNEAVFHSPVKIEPIAIFGYRKEAYEVARRLGLPHYVSAKEFYKKYRKNE